MSAEQLLTQIEALPLSERVVLLEGVLKSIKAHIHDPEEQKRIEAHQEEIRRRRKNFKVETFDLGGEVHVDRDEIYAERGL